MEHFARLKIPTVKFDRQLFGGDSYVILYTYLVNGREILHHILLAGK